MRILVAEDEPKLARALRRGLEHEGYSVDIATNGPDALFEATEWEYDGIVLDVMLPGLDGFEVCERLRAGQRWAPVLLLTARDAVEDRVRGLDSGADDYLVKPFAFDELLARLRALLRRKPTGRSPVLEIDDVVLDPAAHTVTRANQPVALSAREFALLEYLMRHPGEVVSRAQLLDHVWDSHFDGGSNIVNVYIGYLRRKLDHPPSRPLIQTVRGVGYAVGRR